MTQKIIKKELSATDPPGICEALAAWSGLPKMRIKAAMSAGAVWLKRPKGKPGRIRRASTSARAGDLLYLYYDDTIICQVPPKVRCVQDFKRYSVWFKPAGLLTQGTKFGDHCSLIRQIERHFSPKRMVFPVHRLDREARGLVLLAHEKEAAASLSSLFQQQRVEKHYQIHVRGNLSKNGNRGVIDFPLDNRSARTEYRVLYFNKELNRSVVRVNLLTGRFHQIRRHFELLGFPVIGDPRYGRHNKNRQGMCLIAYKLVFICPLSGKAINVSVDPDEVR